MSSKIKILNCKINTLNTNQTLSKISFFLNSDIFHHIITLNPEYILEAQKDENFKQIINSSNLSVPDGIGILWAAKFLSLPASKRKILRYPQVVIQYMYTGISLVFWPKYCRSIIEERVSGVDLFEKILNFKFSASASRKRERQISKKYPISNIQYPKVFLLGGFNGAGKKIKEIYPDTVIGTYEGSPNQEYDEKTIEIINKAKPNILFVAYGNPASKQEKWIARNLSRLPSVKVAMGVGGSFDFLSGQIKRAPKRMQKIGLEWLYRLVRQPKRFKRIWNAVIVFSLLILKEKLITFSS